MASCALRFGAISSSPLICGTGLWGASPKTRASVTVRASPIARKQESEAPVQQAIRQASLASALAWSAPSAAWAEEAARAAPSLNPFAGLTQTETTILLLPVILYSIFSIARTVNPAVKLNDILFAIAAIAVFGNIFSIAILKVKVF